MSGYCPLPPEGWRCTRAKGHEGPCAAWAVEMDAYGDVNDMFGEKAAAAELERLHKEVVDLTKENYELKASLNAANRVMTHYISVLRDTKENWTEVANEIDPDGRDFPKTSAVVGKARAILANRRRRAGP